MSVEEIKAELPKLSPSELQDLWRTLEDIMDKAAAQEALEEEGDSLSLDQVKRDLGL